MAISKKLVKEKVDVEALILKGGSVPSPAPSRPRAADPTPATDEKEDRKLAVQLRLSPEIIREIDLLIEKRVIRVPRHAWFMEAISEKIVKERG